MIRQRATVKNNHADHNTASRRVRRQAALQARRGISNNVNGKPANASTKMQIEKEAKKEKNKRALKNAKTLAKLPKAKTAKEQQARRKLEREVMNKAKKAAKEEKVALVPQPTRKAIQAARGALKEAGFAVPKGHKIQIVPARPPTTTTATSTKKANPKKTPPKKNTNSNNNNNRRGKKKN